MQGGDISNSVAPRIAIVFEGLVGLLPDTKSRGVHDVAVKFRRWDKAATAWKINQPALITAMDMSFRRGLNVDLVTFLSQAEAEALERRFASMERYAFPFANFWHTTPADLARETIRPDLAMVIHSDASRNFTYGSKGRLVSPRFPQAMGRL